MSGTPFSPSTNPVSAAKRNGELARGSAPGFLRRWLVFSGHPPGSAVLWVIGFMALFLIRPWEVMVPELEPLRLETLGVAVLLLLRMVLGRDTTFRLDRGAIAMLVFAAALVATTATSYDFEVSYPWAELSVKLVVFGLCAIAALRSPADLRAFCWAWVAIMAAYELKAIYEYQFHGRGVYRMGFFRLIGIEDSYGHSNAFSGKVVSLLPFIVLLYTTTRRRAERMLLVFAFVLSGTVVVLTGSRAAMLATVFAGLLYILFSKRRVIALAVATAVLLASLAVMPDAIRERYRTLVHPEANASAEASAEGRWIGFRKGIHLFGLRPLVGVGPGVFPESHEYVGRLDYEVEGLQSHNLVAQILGETGLLGAVGFGVLLASIFIGAARLRRIDARAGPASHFLSRLGACCALSATLTLFLGLASHNLLHYNWIWLASLVAAAEGVSRARRSAAPLGSPPRGSAAAPGVPAAPASPGPGASTRRAQYPDGGRAGSRPARGPAESERATPSGTARSHTKDRARPGPAG